MLDAETSSCQMPAPDAVATLGRRLSQIDTQASLMRNNLGVAPPGDPFVDQVAQDTFAIRTSAKYAQQQLDQAANQLPDGSSS
jgi:hypothetical protein